MESWNSIWVGNVYKRWVMERKKVLCSPTVMFKQQKALATKDVVVRDPGLHGKLQVPLPEG
jgi:hypothetical protein